MTPVRIAPISLKLDLDVDAGRKVELHQRVDRLRRGIDDVEETFVRSDLELLAAFLVYVRRAIDGEALDVRGQWNGSTNLRARTLCRVDDLARRVVEDAMIEGLEPDADVLSLHFLSPIRPVGPTISGPISVCSLRRPSRLFVRLHGWRSEASPPWRWERSVRPRWRRCRRASPSRCLPEASRSPSRRWCGSRTADDNW